MEKKKSEGAARQAAKFPKASAVAVARFDEVLPGDTGVTRRKMFGYPCGFVGGYMFCGLFGDDLLLRLGPRERASFLHAGRAQPFEPLPGRVMRDYIVIPGWMERDLVEVGEWVRLALGYARLLPPKEPKKKPAAAKKR
jgi:hypothetical protein